MLLTSLTATMEAASTGPRRPQVPTYQQLSRRLLRTNVTPTPNTLHNLRKKHLHKTLCKSKQPTPPSSDQEAQELSHFRALKAEYTNFTRAKPKPKDNDAVRMVGNPWESAEAGDELRKVARREEYGGEKLKAEHLRELSGFLERDRDKFRWALEDDDVEIEVGWVDENRHDIPQNCGEVL